MDGLLLRTGLHVIGTPTISVTATGNLDVRPNLPSHFPTVGRSQQPTAVSATASSSSSSGSNMISVGEGNKASANSRFSFRYPFRSLFPWVNNNNKNNNHNGKHGTSSTMKGVTIDDAVLADSVNKQRHDVGERKSQEIENEEEEGEDDVEFEEDSKGRDGNWVFKILRVRSLWSQDGGPASGEATEDLDLGGDQLVGDSASTSSSSSSSDCGVEEGEFCEACQSGDGGDYEVDHKEFDRESFSKLLKKVPLAEAKLYAQLSYLGNLAYDIPNMKQRNLLKRQRLRYVTSSIDKRASSEKKEEEEQITANSADDDNKEEQTPSENQETTASSTTTTEENSAQPDQEERKNYDGPRISAAVAFHIAASAASFLNTRTRSILFSNAGESGDKGCEEKQDGEEKKGDGNGKEPQHGGRESEMDMASLMATTDSVTAVVAAKEEVKQAVADDLSSISSAPCEWYTCDDERSTTRFFVIQGSETLASWQANLLFEPTQFEDLDVYVHRGIYEAAKGMYQQMLPEIHAHIETHGPEAKFRFTGHSLGGSLSLLINLMLLIRGDVPAISSLLPVVTFGSPCVMCGGDRLLNKLGLKTNHVQAITMHRDIVPRAFSCHYPNHVAEILKALNGNFRNHPCLNQEHKFLFAPMGEMVILQPDSSFSPQHELLPSDCGMYLLTCDSTERELVMAKRSFLNSPHPLEILSDRGAYGNGGTIQRDHDMNSYLRCVRSVIRKELNRIRKMDRERRRKVWWPMVTPQVVSGGGVVVGKGPRSNVNVGVVGWSFNLQGMVRSGGERFKRFSRVVASQHMHLLVVVLFPAKLLLVGVHSVMGFR